MLAQWRETFKPYLLQIGQVIARSGISANAFSLLAIPFAALAAFYVSQFQFAFAFVVALCAFAIDVLDGSVAKALNQVTPFGNYLDAIVDKVVEVLFLAGFVFYLPLFAFFALAGTLLVSYAKPRAALVAVMDNHDWPGIGERADRLAILLLGMLLAALLPSSDALLALQAMLLLVGTITLVGFVQRVEYAKWCIKHAQKSKTLLPYLQNPKKARK
ncbi:MAG: CDP-alcohol phosphatidyltransferase family protein [Candidatus Diapherotrites archaeon]